MTPHGPALRAFTQLLSPGARVLDAGCGKGLELEWLKTNGFHAEGFDADETAVKAAETRLTPGSRVWQADVRLISLEKESYDGIWCHALLRELPPTGCHRALQSFFSALKPGGILFVSILLPGAAPEAPQTTDDPTHRYRREDFLSLIRQSGFTALHEGRNPADPSELAVIARRL